MNGIENIVNYVDNAEFVGNDQIKLAGDDQIKFVGNDQIKYVGNDQANMFANEQVKFVGNKPVDNLYTKDTNEPCASDEPNKDVKPFTGCEPVNNINNNEVKLSTESIPKTSARICETIAMHEQASPTSNKVPGIEYLLHNHMSNTSVRNHGAARHYQQLGDSKQTGKLNECIENYQQLGDSEQTENDKLSTDFMQTAETKPIVSSVPTSNVTINTSVGTSPFSREHPVARKSVGVRETIAPREQATTSKNVPGIEYLLRNDMRNHPSMINPGYIRNCGQFLNISNVKFNTNIEALTRRDYKNEPVSNNPSSVVVDRSVQIGPAISREQLSVPRKPVGIREPIAIRESIANPNAVPGIEYLLHNEIPSEHLVKKSRPPKEDRPFLCTTCGNKFRQQSHLQQHIRIHTNDRPYHCSFCEKAFKQKSQLNQHERIHTGEKPYKCAICEKAFAQAGQLYSHKKTHGLNINEIKVQKDGREHIPKQRGRRSKIEEIHPTEVGSPPSVIYIMESHPSPQRPSSHFQFPRFRSHIFNNGDMYPSEKLPRIETVVSLGPRPRMATPPSSITATTTTTNTISSPQLSHWKHDTSKESDPGT